MKRYDIGNGGSRHVLVIQIHWELYWQWSFIVLTKCILVTVKTSLRGKPTTIVSRHECSTVCIFALSTTIRLPRHLKTELMCC
jgi:hypothetical protein